MRAIDKISQSHDDWIYMAMKFGCTEAEANELVQEMYIRVHKYVENLERIMYNTEEVNTYYIYVTLRNLYLSGFHKGDRRAVSINYEIHNHLIEDIEEVMHNQSVEEAFDNVVNAIDEIVKDWYWYDKKLWDIHFYKKMSMRQIAKATTISLSSIFNTLSNGKAKVKSETKKKYEEYRKIKSE